MLPLQGWNQINVARAMGVWLFVVPVALGGHHRVTSMIFRDGAGAMLALCSLGMVLAPRMKLVWDVWH